MRAKFRIAVVAAVTAGIAACSSNSSDASNVVSDAGDAGMGVDATVETGAEADTNPLIGRVYVQAGGVGAASYHFDAEDDVYINYTNAPLLWHLDNGQPMPAKKPFTNLAFDVPNRTFNGTIDWSVEGTTVNNGEVRWEYVMIFSSDYSSIPDGTMTSFGLDNQVISVFNFGIELVYAQAASDDAG